MDIGAELRQARQATGLSLAEIARRTKIAVQKLEALEANAFQHLPNGIDLDGIVRAYAREVHLDADAFGERIYRELATTPEWEVVAEDVDAFPREVDAFRDDVDAFPDENVVSSEPAARGTTHDTIHTLDRARGTDPHTSSSLAPGEFRPPLHRQERMTRLALPMVALLGAIGWGAYIYQRARALPPGSNTTIPTVTARSEEADPGNPVGRTDSSREARGAVTAERSGQAPAMPGANAKAEAPDAKAEPKVSPARAGAPDAKPEAPQGPEANDLSGPWTMTTRVESSGYKNFTGLRLGYQLQLRQEGNEIRGEGRKMIENGRPVGARGRTPITLRGTRDGNLLTLTFMERGARRASEGTFVLQLADNGTLRGRFSSDAAQSAGSVEARRREP
jgi:transcriptional regulator with XRE-family HTH domain